MRRWKLAGSTVFVAMLMVVGFAPAASAQADICVSVNGVIYYDPTGNSAECDSGEGSTAVAVGSNSSAGAGANENEEEEGIGGATNTAVSVGPDSGAHAGVEFFEGDTSGDHNTAVGVGNAAHADAGNCVGSSAQHTWSAHSFGAALCLTLCQHQERGEAPHSASRNGG